MRLFLAILLSDEMKDALIHTQNRWYDAGVRGNYTAEENLHLTLAFIGEYPDAERCQRYPLLRFPSAWRASDASATCGGPA